MLRKALVILGLILLGMQFFSPEKNISNLSSGNSIDLNHSTPKEIGVLLKRSCYDCHSNNTVYPWYSNLQPFAWWQQSHVVEGKEELNFDEFNTYNVKKKKHKLEEIAEVIENGEMPLGSYTVIHRNAILSPIEKDKLISWAQELQKTVN